MTPLKNKLPNASATGHEHSGSVQCAQKHEQLEWRDLQNAQIESLKHVWDNPEDDCWNDVPNEATRLQAYQFTVQVDASRNVTVQLPADAHTGLAQIIVLFPDVPTHHRDERPESQDGLKKTGMVI